MPTSPRILKALTAPAVAVSPLMTVFLIHTTHLFINSLLLAPWNPSRCSFWNQRSCSDANIGWILNWLAFAKFHLAVLLGFLGVSSIGANSSSYIESKLGCLSFSILLCYLVEGIMSLPQFNAPMAIFQTLILVLLTLVTLFWISREELQPGSAYLAAAFQSRSQSQSQQRQKLAIPTITLSIQAVLSSLRVVGVAFGSSVYGGYVGDGSRYALLRKLLCKIYLNCCSLRQTRNAHSPFRFPSEDLFVSISSLMLCDAMLVPVVMLFALFFCTIDQHRSLLRGQAVALFVSQIVLSSRQADMMDPEYVKTSMIGTFSSIVLSVAGST